MSNLPIKRLKVSNYGCLNNVDIHFTPLHALIGPNDSGKSTILRAVRTIIQLASDKFLGTGDPLKLNWAPFYPGLPEGNTQANIQAWLITDRLYYEVIFSKDKIGEQIVPSGKTPYKHHDRKWHEGPGLHLPGSAPPEYRGDLEPLRGVRLIRFDPDALRQPSELLPENKKITFFDEKGSGLPGIIDNVINRGDDSFR